MHDINETTFVVGQWKCTCSCLGLRIRVTLRVYILSLIMYVVFFEKSFLRNIEMLVYVFYSALYVLTDT